MLVGLATLQKKHRFQDSRSTRTRELEKRINSTPTEGAMKHQTPTEQDKDLELTRKLDYIQAMIWAGINDVLVRRKVKLSIGDAYDAGSSIKEVLHPEVRALLRSWADKRIKLPEKPEARAMELDWQQHEENGRIAGFSQAIEAVEELNNIKEGKDE